MTQLIFYRGVQGLAAGGLITLAQIVIGDIVAPRDRGNYAALIGGCYAVASVVGPIFGGLLTDYATWRWVFYINLPIGAFTIYFIIAKMPEIVKPDKHYKLDYPGALVLVAAIVALQLPLTWGGGTYAWGSAPVVTLLVLSGPLFVLFFAIQERAGTSPIVPIHMFKIRDFSIACIGMFGVGGAGGVRRAGACAAAFIFSPACLAVCRQLPCSRASPSYPTTSN